MKTGNAIGIAGGWIFLQNIFPQRRLVGAAVGVCKDQRIGYRVVEEDD
jgi:hypothetical protein